MSVLRPPRLGRARSRAAGNGKAKIYARPSCLRPVRPIGAEFGLELVRKP